MNFSMNHTMIGEMSTTESAFKKFVNTKRHILRFTLNYFNTNAADVFFTRKLQLASQFKFRRKIQCVRQIPCTFARGVNSEKRFTNCIIRNVADGAASTVRKPQLF